MAIELGAHIDQLDPIVEAEARSAEIVQIFLGDPQGWKGPKVNFPGGEQSTYTAAAVILAADALGGKSATANLFTDHEALPVVTHQHEDPDHPGRD